MCVCVFVDDVRDAATANGVPDAVSHVTIISIHLYMVYLHHTRVHAHNYTCICDVYNHYICGFL